LYLSIYTCGSISAILEGSWLIVGIEEGKVVVVAVVSMTAGVTSESAVVGADAEEMGVGAGMGVGVGVVEVEVGAGVGGAGVGVAGVGGGVGGTVDGEGADAAAEERSARAEAVIVGEVEGTVSAEEDSWEVEEVAVVVLRGGAGEEDGGSAEGPSPPLPTAGAAGEVVTGSDTGRKLWEERLLVLGFLGVGVEVREGEGAAELALFFFAPAGEVFLSSKMTWLNRFVIPKSVSITAAHLEKSMSSLE
jgi:hypothetical protein